TDPRPDHGRLYSVSSITTSPSSVDAVTRSGTRSASSDSHTENVRVGASDSRLRFARARYEAPSNRIARRLPSTEPIVPSPADRPSTRHSRRPPATNTERLVPGVAFQPRNTAIAECASYAVTRP